MNVQVTQENLNRALSSVARVAAGRVTLPILSNVLIKTANNRLSLSATNLDIAITHYIGAKVSNEGSITVPAKLMQSFVNSLPDGIINLDLEETRLKVTTEQYKSVINGIVADDFPVMPSINEDTTWSISSTIFKKALQQVVFAASSDETRPILTGVLIYSTNQELFMAATDSYRLAEKKLTSNNQDINLLIPANAMQDLLRLLVDEESVINIAYDEQQVLFRFNDIELVTRLLEGKYPEYQNLIPKKFEHQATLERSDFINITKVSSLFARESAGSITIDLNEEEQKISIKSVASQLGENNAQANAKITSSGIITLNSRFLLDALNAFNGEKITFGFNGKLEPTLLHDSKQPDYKHVIMPLKG